MEKQNYDKPLFKVHLIPLANGGPGCNVQALAEGNGVCPVREPSFGEVLFLETKNGCESVVMLDEAEKLYGICYQVPTAGNTIFWS